MSVGVADRIQDGLIITGFIGFLLRFIQQLLHHIGKRGWQVFANLAFGVFAGKDFGQPNHIKQQLTLQVQERCTAHLTFVLGKHVGWIIYKEGESSLFRDWFACKQLFDFFLDDAGRVFQVMVEGIVFAMNVGNEILGAFGQLQNGGQVD